MPLGITEITAIGKLLLDSLNSARTAAKDRRDKSPILSPWILTEILTSLAQLKESARLLAGSLQGPDHLTPPEAGSRFLQDLATLVKRVQEVNLTLLEVYKPGFQSELADAFGADADFVYSLNSPSFHRLARIGIPGKQYAHVLEVCERLARLGHPRTLPGGPLTTKELPESLEMLRERLTELETLTTQFLREHWQPGEI
jgi:hypothetical protein